MTFENIIYLIVLILWLLAAIQGLRAFGGAIRSYRYMSRMADPSRDLLSESGEFNYHPKAAVILPCCGVDEKLEQTVQALARQNYPDLEVIFTFESNDDPAYAAIGAWMKDLFHDGDSEAPSVCGTGCGTGVSPVNSPARRRCHTCRRVVAGLADRRSQKIHNLLAAVEEVSKDRKVLAFLDSDAVPGKDWLGHLVAPLRDETVGAATGYRWYGATGGLAAGVRCAWNAAAVSLMDDEKQNFCWGGATAIRRETFRSLGVARYWDRALSDDLQLTRAVRDAGLRIHFVPQALVSSSDGTTLWGFWSFARRQMIISRICAPAMWWSNLILVCNFVTGGTAVAALFFVAAMGWSGGKTAMIAALFGWLFVLSLAAGIALARQLALRKVLHPPDLTWRDFCWDVAGTVVFSGLLHLNLFAASLTSRRIIWRNTEYELVSADETRVVRRLDSNGR